MLVSIPLSDAQRKIADAPVAARSLVVAAPGTGKTHVVIARLVNLIDEQELSPGHEVLVLSFTRAAVYEIRQRLKGVDGDSRYVGAFTFDSFASALLRQWADNDAWLAQGYDERINSATNLILQNGEAQASIRTFRHLLVDEIQDLVGVRAFFVKAIIGCMDSGFTLLGDPAQGIYNFSVGGAETNDAHMQVVTWLRLVYGEDLDEYTLTETYRAESQVCEGVLWHGRHLYEETPDYREAEEGLNWLTTQLPTISGVDTLGQVIASGPGSTAILCRNNGQALWISRYLHLHRIEHVYQRAATDRVLPAWLGAMFFDFPMSRIGRNTFMKLTDERFRSDDGDPEFAWHLLKRTARTYRETVDLEKVARNLRAGYVPDDFIQMQHAPLTVSTIHRAKGREFDTVNDRMRCKQDNGRPIAGTRRTDVGRRDSCALRRAVTGEKGNLPYGNSETISVA